MPQCYSMGCPWWGLLYFSTVFNSATSVHWGICIYDASSAAIRLYFPVENMPIWLQQITWINPIRHFTEITKQIYLKMLIFQLSSIVYGHYSSLR